MLPQAVYCLTTIVAALALAQNVAQSTNPFIDESTYVNALQVLAFPMAALFTRSNHTRTRRSSTLLLVVWPLYILAQLISLRTFLETNRNVSDLRFILVAVLTGMVTVVFSLELKGPERAEDLEDRASPYIVANFYSR